ncbi:uncharacterized protein METZ01_LOCUS221208 [marine metagenome]|uniref:Ribosomal protein L11 methyltransferase n=1 Tax=marine metagenome TaxID=408172 RepID=A0A382G189_9ZZZZ
MAPDRWLVLSISFDDLLAADLLVEPLIALGAQGVQELDGQLITYLPPVKEPELFVRETEVALRMASGVDDLLLDWSWQEHEDWALLWRRGLGPQKITDSLVVTPSWCDVEVQGGTTVVVIDPGMAFGTAEHATTRGALRLLTRSLIEGQEVLDVGCGSGILAIAAARLGAGSVFAVDLDQYACEAARKNASRNQVEGQVLVEVATVTSSWLCEQGSFDGILANIQTAVLVPLLKSFSRATKGWLILGGITEVEWPFVVREAEALGFTLQAIDAEQEWRSGWFDVA